MVKPPELLAGAIYPREELLGDGVVGVEAFLPVGQAIVVGDLQLGDGVLEDDRSAFWRRGGVKK